MDPLSLIAGPLLGMGVGALKNAVDQPAHQREVKLAADTQRLSPWTNLQAHAPSKEPSMFNDTLQGGMAGLQLGQGMKGGGGASAPAPAAAPAGPPMASAGGGGPSGWDKFLKTMSG